MEKAAPFLAALERVPKRVVEFLREVMSREPEHPEARTVQKTRNRYRTLDLKVRESDQTNLAKLFQARVPLRK